MHQSPKRHNNMFFLTWRLVAPLLTPKTSWLTGTMAHHPHPPSQPRATLCWWHLITVVTMTTSTIKSCQHCHHRLVDNADDAARRRHCPVRCWADGIGNAFTMGTWKRLGSSSTPMTWQEDVGDKIWRIWPICLERIGEKIKVIDSYAKRTSAKWARQHSFCALQKQHLDIIAFPSSFNFYN